MKDDVDVTFLSMTTHPVASTAPSWHKTSSYAFMLVSSIRTQICAVPSLISTRISNQFLQIKIAVPLLLIRSVNCFVHHHYLVSDFMKKCTSDKIFGIPQYDAKSLQMRPHHDESCRPH